MQLFLRRIKKYKLFDKSFNYIFNSYYYSVGKFNPKDMRGFLNRPIIKQIFKYREYVEKNICDLFLKDDLDKKKINLLLIGINHEQQHQELILMDILNIFYNNPLKPEFIKSKKTRLFIISLNNIITTFYIFLKFKKIF